MKYSILFIALAFPFLLKAQDYDVALIPDSLKKNAVVVKRFEEERVTIKSPSKAVVRRKYALTILNEEGLRFSRYVASYSKMFTLGNVDGHLYDASGKLVKSIKRKELSDESHDDEMSLVTDDRLKRHTFYYNSFPYTIEYEDEVEYEGTFFLPSWNPVPTEKYSVQQSRFIVEVPEGYQLRFKGLNIAEPAVTKTKSTIYTWEIKNVTALRKEPYMPDWDEVTPNVYLAPSEFEFGGYKGNMRTWHELGKFMSSLYAGRDVLPQTIKDDVRRITNGVEDVEEKIRLVYEYMQKNTRYIGIQLGIGGWQPFDASYVANKRYGDCKALSNYTVSLLKEAGVKANPVIIKAGSGERGLWDDFPAPFFNHVVMCVPLKNDTIWLECTSQTVSAGYMGSSTGNRKALMLADDGGYVVNTPRYGVKENLQIRSVEGVIDLEGNLKAKVRTHFTGEQQELQHSLMHDASKEQRENYLNKVISLPTYKVDKSSYQQTKAPVPVVDEDLDISAPAYAAISGKRLFVVPNLFNKQGSKLTKESPRKFDITFDLAFKDVDSINLSFPKGYAPEAMAKDVSIKTKFGSYNVSYKISDDELRVVRVYEGVSGTFPASDYDQLVNFYEQIYKSDRSRIVLVKNE